MAERVTWRNRIVGHGEADPNALVANPENFRGHSQAQRGALVGGIQEVGYIRSVTVNQRTGRIIDGHLRVEEAIKAGQSSIAVEYVDLSPEEEKLALLLLDPIAAMATTETPKLDALLAEVQTGEAGVQKLLDELGTHIYSATSTDREGQGVSSTWDMVRPTDNERVVIGEIETRIPADVVELVSRALNDAYEQERKPIHETLEAILVAGVRAVETGSD